MKRTEHLLYVMLFLMLPLCALAAGKTPQERYIALYADMAVREMYRSGVPASITLAQGMLESGNGLSELAVKGNNHFGIKCHNGWTGKTMKHDDDLKGECFRRYSSPEESFRDHSDFLRYRDRYKFLFDYKVTDYKSWAYGLKKAGYATDPSYPKKLIGLIEEHALYEYDTKSMVSVADGPEKEARRSRRRRKVVEPSQAIPASPSVIETVVPLSDSQSEEFHFPLTRQVYSRNGVPFIYAEEGDSYETIASSYDLFTREVRRFNDIRQDNGLKTGMVIYLKSKRNQASEGIEKHVVEEGETLWGISQRYAVKLSKIYVMNGFSKDYVPCEGDVIRLRK